MSSYYMFAWSDAIELASWLAEEFNLRDVRTAFEAMSVVDKLEYEASNRELIQELIRRSVSQRPAYVRKVAKEHSDTQRGLFIAFAILGQARVCNLINLRDTYRWALAPGGGNRETCSGLYSFHLDASDLHGFDWPSEVFEAFGMDDGACNDDDYTDDEDT